MNANARLLEGWQRLRHAFDARPRRERLLLIAALCGVVFALADTLWLSPALKGWTQARQVQRQAQTALAALQSDRARSSATLKEQEAQLRAEIEQLRGKVREVDAALREQAAGLVSADRMHEVLEQVLARHGQVRVRAMRSLGKTDLAGEAPPSATAAARTAKAASAPAPTAAAPSTAATQPAAAALYRHGVEVTLEGGFAELVSYVRALEAMPQRLLWGGLQFRVEKYPTAVLTLRLYTLSLDRHWLEI